MRQLQIRSVVATIAVLLSSAASASGFYFGDNGSKALIQGGAFTAQADDLTALQHNPAGLSQLRGFSFLLDGQLIFHNVSFLRQNPIDPTTGVRIASDRVKEVSNGAGAYPVPFIAGSYTFDVLDRHLTLALGLYGPPASGRYSYPIPNYTKNAQGNYVENPRNNAPQRYGFISDDFLIAYPTLSMSYDIFPWLSVGASAQLVLSKLAFTRTMYSAFAQASDIANEDPSLDTQASVDIPMNVTNFTGVFGILAKPTNFLSVGFSVRPPIAIKVQGKMKLDLGEVATAAKTVVVGDDVELAFTMPTEMRLGVRLAPDWKVWHFERFGLNIDAVYNGWQSLNKFALTPKNVSLDVLGVNTALGPIDSPKRWNYTWSVRAGGSVGITEYFNVHAGFMYEMNAAPAEYESIDFLHFERVWLTGGVSAKIWNFELVGGIAGTPTVTKQIETSQVLSSTPPDDVLGHRIGVGRYSSGGLSVTFGIRGTFGAVKETQTPDNVITPAPAPEPDLQKTGTNES